MNEISPSRDRIRALYPDLAIQEARLNEGGQYNVVLIADDTLIFRLPRFVEGVKRLRFEAALLTAIRSYLTLPVPEPRYASFASSEPGMAFVGYPLLPGEPLWHERVAASDAWLRERLAAQLADFLRSLHSVPLAVLPVGTPLALGFAAADWRAGWAQLCGRIESAVLPRLGATTRARLVAEFAAFMGDDTNFAWASTLIHGDFGTGNILWEEQRGEIAAILDFGAAGLGDPACDLAALLPRARFYRSTFALQEALYGLEHGDEAAFARGIAPYARGE